MKTILYFTDIKIHIQNILAYGKLETNCIIKKIHCNKYLYYFLVTFIVNISCMQAINRNNNNC